MAVDLPHPILPAPNAGATAQVAVGSAVEAPGPERPMSPDEFNAAVAAVTNAFGDPTRREIYLFVRDASLGEAAGVTATEVAEHFALHPNVARHHLEKLTGGGYLTVAVWRGPAPRRRTRRRAPVEALPRDGARDRSRAPAPPRRRARRRCSRARSTRSARSRPRSSPTRSGSRTASRSRQRMDAGAGHRSVRAALAAVADALTAHGFAAHAEEQQGEAHDRLRVLPVRRAAAQQYPHVVCALDRGMIRGMLAGLYGETSPQFEASRPDGDAHCVARV